MTVIGRERIRAAVKTDLPFIHRWLELEARGRRGFIHNWHLIEKALGEGEMTVFTDAEGAVGFLTYGISPSSILQVRSDRQGQCIGRELVEDAIRREEALNNAVLVVECEPNSSVEFWARMGFEVHRHTGYSGYQGPVYMQRLSKIPHESVRGDELEMISIHVYSSSVLFSDSGKGTPDRVYYTMARLNYKKRTLELARRVSVADEPMLRDPVVEICWGGQIFMGKAKHQAAATIGLKRTPNHHGWYLDVINLPDDWP
ncbi:GNAT family N-acetyltransferase [Pseudomonas chlororaphis subsp. aureofaciens]|uniref:GNAT family N-acetyltransferase n=1 Tax=Pseudomonas chlororaphis TaxID=587753 RepID=UPI0035572066